jgi:hypothetical protein
MQVLFFTVLNFALIFAQSPPIDIVEVAMGVVSSTTDAWDIVDDPYDPDLVNKTQTRVIEEIGKAAEKIQQLGKQVHSSVGTETISMLAQGLEQHVRLEARLNQFLELHTKIDNLYNTFHSYVRNAEEFERQTLMNFVNNVVSYGSATSVVQALDEIYSYVVPTRKGVTSNGILELLVYHLQNTQGEMFCNARQSPQQVLYSIYNSLILTELKGFIMVQFGYIMKRSANEGNFIRESNVATEGFQTRTKNIIKEVNTVMRQVPREYWKCDPRKHVAEATYDQFTQLMQGYIENEVDLNKERICAHECGRYQNTKSYGCYYGFCNSQRQCHGNITSCRNYDYKLWVCPADVHSHRRYDYITYDNGLVHGRKRECQTTKLKHWASSVVFRCSYCFCLCDEEGSFSDRYVSLRAVNADYANNRVVTGLRLVKHNRIIHLQVQEGKLLPRGKIDTSTMRWVPVDEMKIDENSIAGLDYHTLSLEKRALDLDDVVAEEDFVLTGVRFKTIGTHLNFEIQVTPFNFTTGQLIDPTTRSVYKNNPRTVESFQNKRSEIKLVTPDVPIFSPLPSVPYSGSDRYIKFVNSDIEKDAAQTTVPFLDVQPVEALQPVPLSGAGIFYKGRESYGGFITPKVITYDFSKHLEIALPEKRAIDSNKKN